MKAKYWLALIALLGFILAAMAAPKNPKLPDEPPSSKEKDKKYAHLLAHRVAKPVKADWYPVHIFRNATITNGKLIGTWNGSGTALIKDGVPLWLVSAAHCFGQDGTYHITIITPDMPQSIWGIESVENITPKDDIAMAKIGPTAQVIKSMWTGNTNVVKNAQVSVARLKKNITTTSLITGEKFEIIGLVQYQKNGEHFYILDYDVVKAESGAGFDAGDQLFVINKYVVLDIDQQRSLGIDPRGGYFSLVTGTQLKWPQ